MYIPVQMAEMALVNPVLPEIVAVISVCFRLIQNVQPRVQKHYVRRFVRALMGRTIEQRVLSGLLRLEHSRHSAPDHQLEDLVTINIELGR
jgi:hypothetical protein